ncbi:MAG TPA: radical SAM protein [Dehalococcoidia bacterium]|nr:radical SAM protein [Dehalococcoidia bacterium]
MDILLVNAPVKMMSQHAGKSPPLGLSYIASVLLRAEYDISARDFNIVGFHPHLLRRILERESPSILGISAHTETYLSGLKIAEFAKEVNPEITVVMGGTHPTVMYQEVASEKSVDVVVRGEGEYAMLELANCLIRNKGSLAEIKGIAYRDKGVVKNTPERPFIKDLDELPFPARGLFPLPLYQSPSSVLLSRGGCPFNCYFCAVNNIWKGSRRFRKPEKVVEEILHIYEHEQAQEINFSDDTFTLDRGRVIELCGLLKKALRLDWLCSTRVDLVDRELLKEMHEAGCYDIQYGIEAGSQKILDSIGKKMKLEQVRDAVRATLDAGIEVTCSFMFPHPEDTEETIREQIHLMKELREIGARETMALTTPLPGTYYYEHADELGIKILANSWDEYDGKHLMIATKYLSKEKLKSLLEELVQDVGLTNEDLQREASA